MGILPTAAGLDPGEPLWIAFSKLDERLADARVVSGALG
jgi:hypothetical protein